MIKIILKKGKGESLKRFHPWVFSGAIASAEGGVPAEGDVVSVYSRDREYLGCGHYQIGSIAVRILSFEERDIDDAFWDESLRNAYRMRRAAGLIPDESGSAVPENRGTDAYRLVHGEGDFLPGLIVDIYGRTAVMQAHSAGMFLARERIASALVRLYGHRLQAVYDKSAGTAPFKAGLPLKDGYLWRAESFISAAVPGGCDGSSADRSSAGGSITAILENGNRFFVDWEEGQKTGFFLDQRDNRQLVKQYAAGRRVLNLFCYTGGFSIYALGGGALGVDSVDSSRRAIDLVMRNTALNGFTSAEGSCLPDRPEPDSGEEAELSPGKRKVPACDGETGRGLRGVSGAICTDAIEYMRQCPPGKYDLMIVDPPAFAKHKGALENALRAYKRLNALAIGKIAPGGIIFTYSCSQVVDKNDFALAVFSAAAQTGRRVRILHRLTQPADHPVNIYHPEGEYLKGLVLYVE